MDHVKTGHADKLYHGPGPVIIKFKDTPELVSIIKCIYIQ